MRTPEFPVVRVVPDWESSGDALGECTGCAEVTAYDPEFLAPGSALLCRGCRLATLGLAGF